LYRVFRAGYFSRPLRKGDMGEACERPAQMNVAWS
jgi:hypothetical protein